MDTATTTEPVRVRDGHNSNCISSAEMASLNIIPIGMSYDKAVKINNCASCLADANENTVKIVQLRLGQKSWQ